MNYLNNLPEANDLTLLDLFSGIGGFHKGLEDAGFKFKKVYFSEKEKHPIANYKYNYPNAQYIGTVEHILQSGIERPHIITFGSPCQDFSLAGNRKGLTGGRSSLISYAIEAISHFRPDIFIWENVKGTFSTNAGKDFWAITQAFANIGDYAIEWQLVNTAWILPQNRERIYLIGHLTTSFRNWRQIFPVTEKCGIHNPTHAAKKDVHENTLTITAKGQNGWTGSYIQVQQINPSTESNNKQPYQQNRIYDPEGLSPALSNDPRSPIVPTEYKDPLIVASRGRPESILTPRRTEYGKSIRKEYEQGIVKEKRKNVQQLEPRNDGLSNTLTSVQKDNLLLTNSRIRRLTEIECERLQGYPDNWTKYGNYNGKIKEVPATHRYTMLGNAVTSKMVQLLGNRLKLNYAQSNQTP